jgi:hypothetical protein
VRIEKKMTMREKFKIQNSKNDHEREIQKITVTKKIEIQNLKKTKHVMGVMKKK